MADSGGERRNFRLSVPVEAGSVVIAVEGQGSRTGSYTLETTLLVGYLENPGADLVPERDWGAVRLGV